MLRLVVGAERQQMEKQQDGRAENGPLEVEWLSEPLDINVSRNGTKVPRRKVKVRGRLEDEWLEKEAGLPPGGVARLVIAIAKAARHGYEARLDGSIRFVHMYDKKQGLYLSPQLMGEFRSEVLKEVGFRLLFEGHEIDSLERARALNDEWGEGEVDEVTPDPMMRCPKCGHHFRAGKKR